MASYSVFIICDIPLLSAQSDRQVSDEMKQTNQIEGINIWSPDSKNVLFDQILLYPTLH